MTDFKDLTVLSGFENGKTFREAYNLSKLDEDECVYKFVIPRFVIACTSSFFRGAFYDSIKNLGPETFEQKYEFEGPDSLDTVKKALIDSFKEGRET